MSISPSLSCMLLVFGSLFFVRLFRMLFRYFECSFAVVLVDVVFYFATLLLFMLSSISLHCSSIQFSLALFLLLFIALLIYLYLVPPSMVLLSFFSCLRLSHISSKSLAMFSKDLTGCICHCGVEIVCHSFYIFLG